MGLLSDSNALTKENVERIAYLITARRVWDERRGRYIVNGMQGKSRIFLLLGTYGMAYTKSVKPTTS